MDSNQGFVGHDPSQVTQYGVAMQGQQQQQTPHHMHHHHRHHSLVGWTAHPVTAYHLVPMDGGACGGCQPMYAHQNQPQHQQQYQQMPQQQQQQPTLYAFPQNMAVQQMQNMPPMTPLSPITPMTPGSGLSPIRRQPSFGNGSFYQPSPSQYQQFQGPGQHQQQQFFQLQPQDQNQHQLQRSQSIPVMSSHVLPGSPEIPRAFHLSPLRRAPEPYSPNMVFATPQPLPQPQPATPVRNTARNSVRNQDNGDVFMDSPAVQAPSPLLTTRHASFMNHRPNKPKPLALSMSNLHPHHHGVDDHRDRDPDYFQSAAQLAAHRRKPVSNSASTGALPFVPSVTPVGSDREYDGGGSSYSTSPLGSDAQAKIRARMRIPFVPRNLRRTSTSIKAAGHQTTGVTGNTLLAAATPTLPTQPESSLEQFLQDHIHSIEANYADEKEDDVEANRKDAGAYRLLSSSDEWYTTSGTDPIRSRHRHRVVETQTVDHDNDGDDKESSTASGVGICDCGMQQCCQCGLFISRPETHTCMVKKVC